MRLTGIVFDLDGTLADTLPICVKAFQDTLVHFTGRRYSETEITAHFGPTEEGMLRRLIPDRAQQAVETFLEVYEREHNVCTAPFPGIRDVLWLLASRGVKLAIVTGKGSRSAEISLRHLGLGSMFDTVETGSADGPIKSLSIRRVLDGWGAEPLSVAYVGDTPHDMRGTPKRLASWHWEQPGPRRPRWGEMMLGLPMWFSYQLTTSSAGLAERSVP